MSKSKALLIFISLLVVIFLVSSCSTEPDISLPDKVIVYKNGEVLEIKKDAALMDKIINLTLERFTDPLSVAKLAISKTDSSLSSIKNNEMTVEFVYTSHQETAFKLEGFRTLKMEYTRLLFPLTGNKEELVFIGDEDTYFSGPLGILSNPEEIIDLLSK